MSQRTNARAFYDEGRWERRDQKNFHSARLEAQHDRQQQAEPRFHSWNAENWRNAHDYRFGRPHGHDCPCQNHGTGLWRQLQAAGFLRPTEGTREHAKSGTER